MTKISKKERALRQQYFEGAAKVVESFGAALLAYFPATQGHGTVDSLTNGPSCDYEALTDYGRIKITVYDDWVHTRFERPKLGIGNQHSGKWNHHCFAIAQDQQCTAGVVDAHLEALKEEFRRVGMRPFERRLVPITPEEIDICREDSIEAMRDLQAFGYIFTIEDFDQVEAAAEYASEVTDIDGGRPEWLVESSRNSILNRSELDAYLAIKGWREHLARQAQASTPKASV